MASVTSPAPYTPTGAGFQNPSFPNPHGPHDARVIIYGYTPSLALCVLAIVLFAISFVVHVVQLVRYKVWFFTPLTLACLLETIGYIFRSLSSKNDPYNIIWFVVQYFLIVVAPVFISASIYVCINRLISWAKSVGYALNQWWLGPRVILWGFVSVDILTTIMQIAGAALVGSSESNQNDPTKGNNILLAGLAIQSLSFTIFLTVLTLFRLTLAKASHLKPTLRAKDWFIAALALASLLVYLRTLFRLAETAQGLFGSVSTNERFFGALEFAPVVIAVWIMAVCHPGRWVPNGSDAGLINPSTEVKTSSQKENTISNV
ncbi:MAG: hypothetical protein M1812_001988 [Candelaria pacifica]|nr:MAG: hypothetical protein M1812_001988 [Candelaria pacifica]